MIPLQSADLAIAIEAAELAPQASSRWQLAFQVVHDSILDGHLDDAERLAGAAFTMGQEIGQPDTMAVYAAQLVNIRNYQGRLAEMVPLVEQAVAVSATESARASFIVSPPRRRASRSGRTDRLRRS